MEILDEKLTGYNNVLKEVLQLIQHAEDIVQRKTQTCNKDFIEQQKRLIPVRRLLQGTHEQGTIVKNFRRSIDKIEDDYQKELLEKFIDHPAIMNQSTAQLERLKVDLTVQVQLFEYEEKVVVEGEGHPLQQKNQSLESILPLPDKSDHPSWRLAPLQEEQLGLLHDGHEFDYNLMLRALHEELGKYKANDSIQRKRSYIILPVEIFQYFFDHTSDRVEVMDSRNRPIINFQDCHPDIFKFVGTYYDIFRRCDIYFTENVTGYHITAVVRNVPASIDRVRSRVSKEEWLKQKESKSQDSTTKLQKKLGKDCILIIFDSEHDKDEHKQDHLRILLAIKHYLLAEAQHFYGRCTFSSIDDIDIEHYSAAVPSQVSHDDCDSGPFSIKYIGLYLENTEFCSKEVLPKGDKADPFWQHDRRDAFRNEIRMSICPTYPLLKSSTESKGQHSSDSEQVQDGSTPSQAIDVDTQPNKRKRADDEITDSIKRNSYRPLYSYRSL